MAPDGEPDFARLDCSSTENVASLEIPPVLCFCFVSPRLSSQCKRLSFCLYARCAPCGVKNKPPTNRGELISVYETELAIELVHSRHTIAFGASRACVFSAIA